MVRAPTVPVMIDEAATVAVTLPAWHGDACQFTRRGPVRSTGGERRQAGLDRCVDRGGRSGWLAAADQHRFEDERDRIGCRCVVRRSRSRASSTTGSMMVGSPIALLPGEPLPDEPLPAAPEAAAPEAAAPEAPARSLSATSLPPGTSSSAMKVTFCDAVEDAVSPTTSDETPPPVETPSSVESTRRRRRAILLRCRGRRPRSWCSVRTCCVLRHWQGHRRPHCRRGR